MASGGETGFTLAVATEAGAAEQLNQIIAAWQATADRGVPLELVEVEHTTKYALDVRNKDTTSSLVARFRNAAGENLLTLVKEAVTIGKPATFSGTATFLGAVTLPDDTVDDTKVGNRVPQLYRRQGGSATNWWTGGTTTYTPTTVRMQVGTGTLAGGTLAITFPQAFSDVPVVFAIPVGSSASRIVTVDSLTATGFTMYGWDKDGVAQSPVAMWLAIGPE